MTRYWRSFVPGLASLLIVSAGFVLAVQAQSGFSGRGAWGPKFRSNADDDAKTRDRLRHREPPRQRDAMAMVRHWNHVAINATGLDHTPVGPTEHRVFGEQLGPGRASRAMAIVHIAIFDAVNAIAGDYQSYTDLPRAPHSALMEAAIAAAAHDTLCAMFPSQAPDFDEVLGDDLGMMPDRPGKAQGLQLGHSAAARILAKRAHDGSQYVEPKVGIDFITNNAPGKWRQDPISLIPLALGAKWGQVKPFVISSGARYRVPPPPDLDSAEYAEAYDEVKRLGGDGIVTPTERTYDQTIAGIFWAYDGTPSMCAPPRLYNQIIMTIAAQMGTNVVDLTRLLALANVAMADAGIAIWESKYYYQYWRPITAIRESDAGTGPTGLGDGNPLTIGDPAWTPLGAPASNLNGPNFTPPFPGYPSGHGTFGGALFQTLRRFYRTDDIAFTFVSDEFNGITKDHNGVVRPLIPRSFQNFSEAEEENGQSRIYLGIHFSFDKTEAIAQGRRVADYVFKNAFGPARGRDR
jgi:hypothetical protein